MIEDPDRKEFNTDEIVPMILGFLFVAWAFALVMHSCGCN